MSNKDTAGFSIQVIAGALAAITAALLGSTLGMAGTVLGAGIASVISTVGAAVYLRSIRGVHTRVAAQRSGRRRITLIAGSLLAFVLGMLVVTSVEWVRGESFSGSDGTTIGGIVLPRPEPPPAERPAPPPAQPSGSPAVTTTPTPSSSQPQTTPSQPTTSTEPSSPPATTSTTTGTTTTEQPPPSGLR